MRKQTATQKSSKRIYKDIDDIKNVLARVTKDLKKGANGFASDSVAQALDKSDEMKEEFSEYVSRKPLKSVSIALLTGAVIGFFMHR